MKITFQSVLLALSLLLLFSCISFDIADAPSRYVTPQNAPAHNWCGPLGAWIAFYLLYYVGPGVFLFTGALTAWLIIDLARKSVNQPVLRLVGLCMLAATASTTFHLVWPEAGIFPFQNGSFPMGNGGLLGIAIAEVLTRHVAALGTLIIVSASWFVGAVLLADKAFLWLLHYTVSGFLNTARGLLPDLASLREQKDNVANIWKRLSERQKAAAERPKPARSRGAILLEAASRRIEDHLVGEEQAEPARRSKRQEVTAETPPKPEDEAETHDNEPQAQEDKSPVNLFKRKKKAEKKPQPIKTVQAPKQDPKAFIPKSYEDYEFPPLDLLEEPEYGFSAVLEKMVGEKARALEELLAEFGIEADVVNAEPGPAITMYELQLAAGVKVSQISNLSNDIARALGAGSVRVVAPLAGKHTIGIEVPNTQREIVRLKELLQLGGPKVQKMAVPLFLGKDSAGGALISDLASMPHLLIAGTTGSGKSVCINTIITSVLMTRRPDEVKLILVDPKMVEMASFDMIPHLMCPTVTDTRRAEQILEWAVTKMDERYELLAEAKVRNIASYNALGGEEIIRRFEPSTQEEEAKIPKKLPYIVIIIDELADLMMTSGKEVEAYIVRIAQKSRAVGIHLVVATQRPQATVVTGLIKSNMPARIAFRVAARMDSRIILDQNGGETLLGQGDMLFLIPGTSDLVRSQGAYLDDREIRDVVKHLRDIAQPQFHPELMQMNQIDITAAQSDDLFNDAVEIVLETKRGSVSLLQRRLSIGYARASRMIEMMAAAGILGEYKGSQAREVILSPEEWEQTKSNMVADTVAGYPDLSGVNAADEEDDEEYDEDEADEEEVEDDDAEEEDEEDEYEEDDVDENEEDEEPEEAVDEKRALKK